MEFSVISAIRRLAQFFMARLILSTLSPPAGTTERGHSQGDTTNWGPGGHVAQGNERGSPGSPDVTCPTRTRRSCWGAFGLVAGG
jgi:hypothetical protein